MFEEIFPIILAVASIIVFVITLVVALRNRKTRRQIARKPPSREWKQEQPFSELPPSPDPRKDSPPIKVPDDADVG
jgi:hypothetical protein